MRLLRGTLPDSAVQLLATDARTELYAPGEFVVRQATVARSCICAYRRVNVLYTPDAGAAREMARIRAAACSASSRIDRRGARRVGCKRERLRSVAIGKTAFSAVLSANPDFAELISQRLASSALSSTRHRAAAREPTRVGR